MAWPERKFSTFKADTNDSYAEVWMNFKEEVAFVRYFDDNGKHFFTEEFPGKSIHYVNDAAENWTLGIKKLEV